MKSSIAGTVCAQFEHRPTIIASAFVGRAIQSAITALHKTGIRISSIPSRSGEPVESAVAGAVSVELEHDPVIVDAAKVSRAIKGSITALHETGKRIHAIRIKTAEHGVASAVGAELEHSSIIRDSAAISYPVQDAV